MDLMQYVATVGACTCLLLVWFIQTGSKWVAVVAACMLIVLWWIYLDSCL